MKLYGLIGKTLSHSFSQRYFLKKFRGKHNLYINFELPDPSEVRDIFRIIPELTGVNVTIPYKESVIPFLDQLDIDAKTIGAVNTILARRVGETTELHGYNTDWIGFKQSLEPFQDINRALILGTGGASKAIKYALDQAGISYKTVSRSGKGDLTYDQLFSLETYDLIVNTTPLGTYPNTDQAPDLPYGTIGKGTVCYDLVYNPAETLFLKKSKESGAIIRNGLEMLQNQAEESWKIWQ